MLHHLPPRGVDLLRGRGLSAVLLQLRNGEAGENTDRKLYRQYQLINTSCEIRGQTPEKWDLINNLTGNIYDILIICFDNADSEDVDAV